MLQKTTEVHLLHSPQVVPAHGVESAFLRGLLTDQYVVSKRAPSPVHNKSHVLTLQLPLP